MQQVLKDGFHLDWTPRSVAAVLEVKDFEKSVAILGLIAKCLNESGYSVVATIKTLMENSAWTTLRVKELIWRPVQKSMYGIESTTELEKLEGQIEKIHEVIMRELGEKYHIEYHEFPHDPKKVKEHLGGYKSKAGQTPEGVVYPEHVKPTI